MVKPTKEQFDNKLEKIDDVKDALNAIVELVDRFQSGIAAFEWDEIPDEVYDRAFAQYAQLEAELKQKAIDL